MQQQFANLQQLATRKFDSVTGFNKKGIHVATGTAFAPDGFNLADYNRDGYNREGFNKAGLYRNGSQYNPDGYNHEGYNRDGFDRQGVPRSGWEWDLARKGASVTLSGKTATGPTLAAAMVRPEFSSGSPVCTFSKFNNGYIGVAGRNTATTSAAYTQASAMAINCLGGVYTAGNSHVANVLAAHNCNITVRVDIAARTVTWTANSKSHTEPLPADCQPPYCFVADLWEATLA
eukprot:gnl/Hemi2/17032_TR5663_c0_g1_i2.p1 gnl/Hemi2/17032_TR5663_c0_g1~~gnl/Hemi2/17032_TR5663_c0_g1_i2.p1  ORF type:complete len:233 (+),score=57.15 gnl/Hemi2/17032_TR5663_c0_g1_i2:281-979(+)